MASVDVTSNKNEFLSGLRQKKEVALETIGLLAEGHAKAYCPVDTGRLRNSISHAHDEDSAYIGTNVEYAPYVELGSSRQKEHPYLKPAVQRHIDEYKDAVKKVMGG